MGLFYKLFGRTNKRNKNENHEHFKWSNKMPGPMQFSRKAIKLGDERRYCQFLKRDVVLVHAKNDKKEDSKDDKTKEMMRKFLECEWTIKDYKNKQCCYNNCIHNGYKQNAIITASLMYSIPMEDVINDFRIKLGLKDYAPKK